MHVLLVPQYNPGKEIIYEFKGELITATIDGITDVFDFSTMPDGVADQIDTILPLNPVLSAKKVNGVLFVELLNFIDEDATEEERFPDWQVIE